MECIFIFKCVILYQFSGYEFSPTTFAMLSYINLVVTSSAAMLPTRKMKEITPTLNFISENIFCEMFHVLFVFHICLFSSLSTKSTSLVMSERDAALCACHLACGMTSLHPALPGYPPPIYKWIGMNKLALDKFIISIHIFHFENFYLNIFNCKVPSSEIITEGIQFGCECCSSCIGFRSHIQSYFSRPWKTTML